MTEGFHTLSTRFSTNIETIYGFSAKKDKADCLTSLYVALNPSLQMSFS
jgi:hypothetical protein